VVKPLITVSNRVPSAVTPTACRTWLGIVSGYSVAMTSAYSSLYGKKSKLPSGAAMKPSSVTATK
jgi:hypothetical protein